MNKNEYKKAMSGVHPSEQAVERIMDMTNSKRRKGLRKGVIAVLVILSVLLCSGLTANAATDGAVAEAINQGIKRITLRINGEEVDPDKYLVSYNKHIDENGKTVEKYGYALHEDVNVEDGASIEYEVITDDEGVEIRAEGSGVDGEFQIETEDFIEPTTSTNK